jgi:hypothetical protein
VRTSCLPVSLAACLALLATEDARPQGGQPPVFRASTELTLLRFQVIRSQRYVGGLTAGDIRLLDNGVEQRIDFFEGGCDAPRTLPIEVAVLFDLSRSVLGRGLLDWVHYRDLFLGPLPSARVSVYGFSRTLSRFCAPTRDPERLRDALDRMENSIDTSADGAVELPLILPRNKWADPNGESWIFESVRATAGDASDRNATRVVLAVSDGLSTTDTGADDVAGDIEALGVSVFPIILGNRVPMSGVGPRGDFNRRDFGRLGQLTGGRSFDPELLNAATVRTILSVVAETIRCEYVAGVVRAPSSAPPARHVLEVKLRAKELGELHGGRRTIRY